MPSPHAVPDDDEARDREHEIHCALAVNSEGANALIAAEVERLGGNAQHVRSQLLDRACDKQRQRETSARITPAHVRAYYGAEFRPPTRRPSLGPRACGLHAGGRLQLDEGPCWCGSPVSGHASVARACSSGSAQYCEVPALQWRPGPDADVARITLAGFFTVRIVIRDERWEIDSDGGQLLAGPCASREHGLHEALRAVRDVAQQALGDITRVVERKQG